MKFNDILALAKQGYTPADIRELMAMQTEENNQQTETQTKPIEQAQDDHTDDHSIDVPSIADKVSGEAVDPNAEKISALEAEIKRLQEENTRIARPLPDKPEKSQNEILNDLVRKLM